MLAFLSVSGWFCPELSNALSEAFRDAFQYEALHLYVEEPPLRYKLGGRLEDGEVDCSLFIDEVEQRADIIERRRRGERTVAWRVYRGLDGYYGAAATGSPHVGDIYCVRVPPSAKGYLPRPEGISHVGGVIWYGGQFCIIDANGSTKGIRIGPIKGMWVNWVPADGKRRLSAGDE